MVWGWYHNHQGVPFLSSEPVQNNFLDSLGDEVPESDWIYTEYTSSSCWSLPSSAFICTATRSVVKKTRHHMAVFAFCEYCCSWSHIPFEVHLLTVHVVMTLICLLKNQGSYIVWVCLPCSRRLRIWQAALHWCKLICNTSTTVKMFKWVSVHDTDSVSWVQILLSVLQLLLYLIHEWFPRVADLGFGFHFSWSSFYFPFYSICCRWFSSRRPWPNSSTNFTPNFNNRFQF